jgi:hypothetical protein
MGNAAAHHASMTRTRTKPRRLTSVDIREDIQRGNSKLRVDRDKGVIYGVKAVGLSSPNTHDVRGVEGTDYTTEALQNALPLYEGINVNVDHPPRQQPNKERSAYDRFAWLEKCELQEGGIFAELHFLDPTDPLAVRMMNAAENKPDAFALSHNAVGRGEVKNKRYVIHEIPEVRSVDIVSDGGTNHSLCESRQMKQKTTLRKVIQESKNLTPATRKRLLEMGNKYCREDMDEEKDMSADGTMEADEDGPSAHDHMTNAIGSLVKSDDPDDHDKAAKVLKLMKPKDDSDKEDVEEGDDSDDPDSKDEGESQDGRGNPTKGKGEENSKDDDKGKENMESRQRKAKKRCELAGVEPTADLLESLARVPSTNWDGILISIKRASGDNKGKKSSSSAPRSAAAGSVDVRESRHPGDGSRAKDWATQLLSRN